MRLYIVRHGQTEGNADRVHQTDSTPLTEKGKDQARRLAERFAGRKFDVILASSALRAKHTAEFIHQATQVPLELFDILKEKRGPSEIFGQKIDSVLHIWKDIEKNRHKKDYHYSDEENDSEFISRMSDVLAMIEKRSEEDIILVTHGYVIRGLIGTILFGSAFTYAEFIRLNETFQTSNTGITFCEFENKKWIIRTYNDHAHLLD